MKAAGISDLLQAVLSVESVGVFKPHGSVYDLVGRHFGCQPEEVLFVSSNGWDAAAASGLRIRDGLGQSRQRADGPTSLETKPCASRFERREAACQLRVSARCRSPGVSGGKFVGERRGRPKPEALDTRKSLAFCSIAGTRNMQARCAQHVFRHEPAGLLPWRRQGALH